MEKKLDYRTLVARVKNEITRFQYNSELIIIAVELSLLFIAFIRYFTIPAHHASVHHLLTDPVMLAIFSSVVLLRLAFLYKNKLSSWLLSVFIITEMLLILFAAKIHEVQFEPTQEIFINTNLRFINYVILLIVLRTLRFEPLMVFIAGMTAALGWIILTLSTLHAMELNLGGISVQDPRIFTYLIHEGGRVLLILFVTAILTLALYRGRNILWRGITDRQAIKDLLRFFDTEVADKITLSKNTLQPGQGVKKEAAVLFVDMRGFTKASELLTPKKVIMLLSQYQTLIVPIIHKHKGTIDKFMGDGIMASFGTGTDSKTYAADALNAVDEIVAAVKVWQAHRAAHRQVVVDVGSGLAVGSVIFGVIGDSGRLEYTVIGNAVNLAAKLEKHNKIEHSHAITTHDSLTQAIAQGYVNKAWSTLPKRTHIEDVDAPVDLVVRV